MEKKQKKRDQTPKISTPFRFFPTCSHFPSQKDAPGDNGCTVSDSQKSKDQKKEQRRKKSPSYLFIPESKPIPFLPLPPSFQRSIPRVIPPLHRRLQPAIQLPLTRINLHRNGDVLPGFGFLQAHCTLPPRLCVLDLLLQIHPLPQLGIVLVALVADHVKGVELLLTAEADAEAVAVADVLRRAPRRVACEDELPHVFPDAAADEIFQGRVEQPVAVFDVLVAGDAQRAVPRQRELAAARLRQHLGDGVEGEYLRPRLGDEHLFHLVRVSFRLARVHPVRAAGIPGAAHVEEAFAGYALGREAAHHMGGVEAEHVGVVPGVAVCVHEDHDVGEVVVVVD